MFGRLGLLAICVMLGGCVASRPDRPNALSELGASNYRQVLAETKVVPDPHAGWTEVLGPVITQYGEYSTVRYMAFTRFGDGEVAYRIQAQGLFPKRVYLGDVYSAGRKLKSKVLDRERTECGHDCTTVETISVTMTETELETYAAGGLTFEVIGRRDSIVVSIPASYFAAVLERHRREFGGREAA
jgi:hypothetical protein